MEVVAGGSLIPLDSALPEEEDEAVTSTPKQAWDDAQFHAAIDKALLGNVPDPWP